MNAGDQIIMPTAEETKAIDEQIASAPADFELDDAWFEGAKTTQELFPEAYERAVRQKEALKSGLIQRVTVTLDRETIAWFKAQTGEDGETGGTRWLELGRTDPPGPCPGPRRPEARVLRRRPADCPAPEKLTGPGSQGLAYPCPHPRSCQTR